MSIKDLFDVRIKTFQNQHDNLSSASVGAESIEYIKARQKQKEMYIPPIDFSTASNFAKYGSAELYYDFAFKRIYNHYPYDGTLAEKVEFETESTHLDRYIFEYIYPRTNGYINLGYQGFGGSIDASGYHDSVSKEYIFVFGGIHTASGGMANKPLVDTFDKSNIYDVSDGEKKGASLEFTSTSGSTIEFWLKKDAFDASKATKEVIFDLWNQETEGAPTYGRVLLNIDNSNNFTLTWNSGSTTGTQNIQPGSFTVADGKWHHYAVSLKKESSNMKIKFYQDGTLQKTTTDSNDIGDIKGLTKGLCAAIGALNTAPVGVGTLERGDGKFSGSMDEFRYWKKELTPEEVGLNWFSQVGGGTNKHSFNKELGIYFKFNEGITATSQDSTILDYSGRIANGTWTGYTAGARNTGSAMVLSGHARDEFKDPIMYSYHPDVSSKHTEMKTSGSIQDAESTSGFYNLFPAWIMEEDTQQGKNAKYLSQIIASYFDTVHAQISGMNNLKDMTYSTGSLSPNVFSNDVLREKGFVMPNMFVDASIIEAFRNKDRNEIFERDIEKVKNIIYQNIYNNINFIFNSKGTEKSYRNLFRCIGFDTELVKVNMYSDNATLLIEDRYESKSVTKPVIKFNAINNMKGTLYQSSSSGLTYLTGSEADTEKYTSITLEADFILPKKLKPHETGYFSTSFLSASVAGFHRALTSSADNYTWHSADYSLRMYAVRDEIESEHVKFVLTGSGVNISSSLYRMAYDNQKWLLAARVKHEDYPYAGITGSISSNKEYVVEFYGINTNGPYVEAGPFSVSANVSNATGKKLLSVAKRIYAGSHRTNYTGSVLQSSDINLSQIRYWQSYVDNEALKQHALDSVNYGSNHALSTDSLFATPDMEIPKSETLALHWDFGQVTTSDETGIFTFTDRSSGSVSHASKYSFIGNITNRLNDGKGENFPVSSKDVVDKATIYSAKRKPAESAYSSDGVKIVGEEQEAFFQDDDRNDIYFSFEKSPYGAVSEEMMNMFATIKDFSNMVGMPINRYRQSYKTADHLKKMFFSKVTNDPNPEKYFEYYKWIDSSVSYAIAQLLPASTRLSDGVKNIVESHILERNKFREKYPLTSEKVPNPEGGAFGAAHSKVNWSISHAPQPQSPIPNHKHCVWQKTRRRFSEPEPTPAPISAPGIDTLRDIINGNNIVSPHRLVDSDGKIYEGSTYALRMINKVYDYSAVFKNTIHGGTNYYVAKKRNFVHKVAYPHGPKNSYGVPTNVMVVGVGQGQGLVDQVNCEDKISPNVKSKYDFHSYLGEFSDGTEGIDALSDQNSYNYQIKGIMSFPMNFMSQSVSGGYADIVNKNFKTKLEISNLHSDTVDITNDVPMQGPFPEMHVGGHQSRHVKINKYDTSLRDDETGTAPTNNIDNRYTRPEAWRILIGEHSSSTYQDGAIGIVPADYGVSINVPLSDPRYGKYPDIAKKKATYFREEKAKRPVNVRHIQHDSGGSRVGNYNKKYEVLNAVGRKENNLLFRVSSSMAYYLAPRVSSSLPDTTHPMSLFGQMPTNYGKGNVFGYHFNVNHRQPDALVGAPTTTAFVVTGSGVSGSSVGSFVLKGIGLGNQENDVSILVGTSSFTIQTSSTPTSDSSPNYYVVTGASNGAMWSGLRDKMNSVLTDYNVAYTSPSAEYSRNVYSSASTNQPTKTHPALSSNGIPDFDIHNDKFALSSWIYLKTADSSSVKKTLFSFQSGSGEVSRELYLTGAHLVYDVQYYNQSNVSQKKVVKHTWNKFYNAPGITGSWANILLYHNRTGVSGTGSVTLFVNGQTATSFGVTAPGVTITGTTSIPNSDSYIVRSDGKILFLNDVTNTAGACCGTPWVGGIDEIIVWGGAAVGTTSYASVLYNGGKQLALVTNNCALPYSNIKAYYPFAGYKGRSGETVEDSTSNNNHLTASGIAGTYHHTTGGANITGIPMETIANFTITALTGGSPYDVSVTIPGGCQNFLAEPVNVAGGFVSGASPNGDDTIQFTSSVNPSLTMPTFQIVNEIKNNVLGSNIGVTASYTASNMQFWNNLSQSIKDNTIFDIINIVTTSGGATHPQATFHLTASDNNSIYNDYYFKTSNNTAGQFTFISSGSFSGGDTAVNAVHDIVLAVPGRNQSGDNSRTETIISSRFAAPGGPEVDSAGFLDVYSREYSVHNAIPYRNLTVRGKSSGEVGTIRLDTHIDKREGLFTFLTRHCGKFGSDSKHGTISETNYNITASYQKQHRNTSYRYALSGTIGGTTDSTVLVSRHDNALVTSPIPSSEFQYSWINSAVSGSSGWRESHNITGYSPYSGVMQDKNVYNRYVSFGNNDSHINIGTASKWDAIIGSSTSGRSTIAFWVNREATDSFGSGDYLYYFGNQASGYISLFVSTNRALYWRTYGDSSKRTWNTGNGVLPADEWAHVAVTWAGPGTSPTLYINGEVISWSVTDSFTTWGGIQSDDCFIGNQEATGPYYVKGYMDDFVITDTLLTATNIRTLMNQGRGYSTPEQLWPGNTKLFYKFDSLGLAWEPQANKLTDSGPDENHSVSHDAIELIEEYDYEDVYPITFPTASEIYGRKK